MKPKLTLTKPEVTTKPEPDEAEPTPLGLDGWNGTAHDARDWEMTE